MASFSPTITTFQHYPPRFFSKVNKYGRDSRFFKFFGADSDIFQLSGNFKKKRTTQQLKNMMQQSARHQGFPLREIPCRGV